MRLALLTLLFAAAAGAAEPALEDRIIAVPEQVKPSVVFVQAIVRVNDRKTEVTGSGVIASADGLVLTNHHVVERAEKVEVSVPGRKQPYRAEVLGNDKQTDLAVLRIQPERPLPASPRTPTYASASGCSRSATRTASTARSRSGSCPRRAGTSRSRIC
jgi:S1-C subfamily serine protease